MEKLVRIVAQQPLRQTPWTSPQGEQKMINSVELTLTDGIDTFTAEVQGEDAVNMAQLDRQYIYDVQCRMSVREWTSQTGQKVRSTSIRIIKIQAL